MALSSANLLGDGSTGKAGQNPAAKKRRRRAAATGAADDCFTCQKRSVKCDRRRPYCTQCLEIGKECGGYKTTLTWGVGVASRGKLRGLSLPIANSGKKAPIYGEDGHPQLSSVQRRGISPTSNPEPSQNAAHDMLNIPIQSSVGMGPTQYSPNAYHPTSPIRVPTPQMSHSWTLGNFSDAYDGCGQEAMARSTRMPLRPNALRRIQTAPVLPYEESMYSTPSSAFSDSDNPSPRDYPATPEDFAIPEPYVGSYSDSYSCPPDVLPAPDSYAYTEAPRSYPMSSAMTMPPTSAATSSTLNSGLLPSTTPPTTFADLFQCNVYTPSAEVAQSFAAPQNVDQEHFSDGFSDFSVSHTPSSWPDTNQQQSGLHTMPLRTRFFLERFDKVICPLLVAVDDSRNPYRLHCLSSIQRNLPLQYAISALVLSQTRKCRASEMLASFGRRDDLLLLEASTEEAQLRSKAVEAFNIALRHPNSVALDAILIELQVLCLLKLSENGFGKFKVGLAGVQRLLAASHEGSKGRRTVLADWASKWLTWLDVIASVSIRESSSSSSDSLDVLHMSASLGALEYVANYQGRLFEKVARLASWSISNSRLTPAKDYYGHSASIHSNCDFTQSSTFWSPLQYVEIELNSFARNHPNFHAYEADPVINDHIAAVFDHAITIYAELQTMQDSSSLSVQQSVSKTFDLLSAIPENSSIGRFLLWPLLIMSTECVDVNQRDVISRRIAAGTTGLLFGDFTCVDVLWRVWTLLDSDCDTSDSEMESQAYVGLSILGARAPIWRKAVTTLNDDMAPVTW